MARGRLSSLRDGVLQKRRSGGERGRRSPPKSLSLLHGFFRTYDDFREDSKAVLACTLGPTQETSLPSDSGLSACPRAISSAKTCPPRCWRLSLRSEERRMYCLFLGPTQDDKLWLLSGLYCTPHHRRERRDADFRRWQFRSQCDNPGSNPQVVTCDIPDKYRYSQPQARL